MHVDRAVHRQGESELRAESGKFAHARLCPVAEPEVGSHDDGPDPQLPHQDVPDEGLRLDQRQRAVEGQHDHPGNARLLQELQLALGRHQGEGGVAPEHRLRVGVEREHGGAGAERGGLGGQAVEDRPVPQVHPVEVADGERHRVPLRRQLLQAARDQHRRRQRRTAAGRSHPSWRR